MASHACSSHLGDQNRRDGYTHDAELHGQSGVRGVRLSESAYVEGCWVAIREAGESSIVDEEVAPIPAAKPTRNANGRQRRSSGQLKKHK